MSAIVDFKKISDAIGGDIRKHIQAYALELGASILERTPVDVGIARNSWFFELNAVPKAEARFPSDYKELKKQNKSVKDSDSVNSLRKAVKDYKLDDTFYIVNRTPYIVYIENDFGVVKGAIDQARIEMSDTIKTAGLL
jgi:hypothetical protein